jgi:hypothetical protein
MGADPLCLLEKGHVHSIPASSVHRPLPCDLRSLIYWISFVLTRFSMPEMAPEGCVLT